jgi:hypothetical protein
LAARKERSKVAREAAETTYSFQTAEKVKSHGEV